MDNLGAFLLETFVLLFIVVDPVMLVPVLLTLTHRLSAEERFQIAKRAFWIGTILMFSFALGGQTLLGLLGVSHTSLQIAGGLILLLMGVRMVLFDSQDAQQSQSGDVAIFPIAVPLLSGPGALTAIVVQMEHAKDVVAQGGIFLIIILIGLIFLTLVHFSQHLMRILGERGAEVCNRLVGLILTALAIQFILDGTQTFVRDTWPPVRSHKNYVE